jgi:hypothetical protein
MSENVVTKKHIIEAAEEFAAEVLSLDFTGNLDELDAKIAVLFEKKVLAFFAQPGAASPVREVALPVMVVGWDTLRATLNEVARLSKQVDDLQTRGSELVKERQAMRDPNRATKLAFKLASEVVVASTTESVGNDGEFFEEVTRILSRGFAEVLNP